MTFFLIFMLIFPFLIDGYQFINFSCSPTNMTACLIFRKTIFLKGTITNVVVSGILGTFVAYSMLRSRREKAQIHSMHAKIERRLIYQAIFSSVFQLLFFILNYISSIVIEVQVLQVFVYSAQIGYHLQHYALMVTHFVFSPTFKMAFLNFYHLGWLSRHGKSTTISTQSKAAQTKIFVTRNTV